jgi:hypothetical protein
MCIFKGYIAVQKRHFELIAEVLRNLAHVDSDCAQQIRTAFADMLQRTNPRFDRDRFLSAATPRDCQ